ncbi:hypothetical protein F511_43679 [Dorcoceras hygrometricum]|uniref:Uncharacterized protein n=1 Tax=Dorcoceras hygrometricum TaxID=472368 RepID=A0A2Z7D2I6_9LAMI|nr:hypothetical protein F511_43679 [Dorcoceras hygrometricum]
MFEGAVTEFFANAMVIDGTIVSFVENWKLALTKEVLSEAFGIPTEGLVGFLDILTEIVVEMRRRFSVSNVPFREPNKNKEMKMEYRLLQDIVAKALCAKVGSFDWYMVNNPNHQPQGFAVHKSVLLERLAKAELGDSVKLHPQKVLSNKSVHTYMKKNLNVVPAGETSKVSGAIASEQQSTANGPQALPEEPEKAAVENPKMKKIKS